MDLDAICKRARADLILPTSRGEADLFLWEHSCRVAENARIIAVLPTVSARAPHSDAAILAALYHDAGWAVLCRNGELDRLEVHLSPTSAAVCEHAAGLMERSLVNFVPAATLEAACEAVRDRIDKETSMIEAQVVAEAESLDEFGLLSLWLVVRRGALDGRGIQACLDTWRRKQEYQFWRARLKDAFRFDEVRRLAEKRLASLERVMAELLEQHLCRDLAALAGVQTADWPLRSGLV
jgi:uncharacterized protein (DUF1778 family)